MSDESTPIRVLVVDDDPQTRDLLGDHLERADDRIEVVAASGADEALEALEADAIDCVVSDYEMPGRTGLELLDVVRQEYDELPFILFTGRGSEHIASEAVSQGVSEYLRKGSGTEQYDLLANRIVPLVSDRRSEEAVTEAHERFQRLVEESTDVILIVDETATIQYATPSARRVLGRTPDELVGTDGLEPVHPEERDLVQAQFAELAQTPGTRRSVEFRYLRPDDEYIWAEARGRNLLDDETVSGIVVYTRDITERKRYEDNLEALQRSAAHLIEAADVRSVCDRVIEATDTVLDADHNGIWLLERDGERLEPMGATDLATESFGELPEIPADAGSPVWRAFDEGAVRTDQAITVEVSGSGSTPPLEGAGVVPIGDHGVLCIASSAAELTEQDLSLGRLIAANAKEALDRIQSQRATESERDRFAALFEMIPDPVGYIRYENGEPIIQAANEAYRNTFRSDEKDIVGRSVNDVIVPPEREREAVRLDERAMSEGVVTQEVRRQTADGVRDFLFRSAPIGSPSPNGEYFGIYIDITDRKDRERELERKNERLEEFASIVSHDLRNPLNVAQGRSELLADDCDSEHLHAITRAHYRMETLIEDLLALARGQRVDAFDSSVHLPEIVRDSWEGVGSNRCTLSVETDRTIEADPDRLRQLLENLLRNAVEHAGPEVTVTVGDLPDGFYVEDDGPGIPATHRARIFDRGFSTTSSGTGYGLSIVRTIASAHDWQIEVAESAADGARIEVRGVSQGTAYSDGR